MTAVSFIFRFFCQLFSQLLFSFLYFNINFFCLIHNLRYTKFWTTLLFWSLIITIRIHINRNLWFSFFPALFLLFFSTYPRLLTVYIYNKYFNFFLDYICSPFYRGLAMNFVHITPYRATNYILVSFNIGLRNVMTRYICLGARNNKSPWGWNGASQLLYRR